jgi:AcrR family transcriptional regulator
VNVPRPTAGATVPHAGLRETVLREATRLFAERGYAATSLREVANAAMCTKPALYHHFTSKEDLYREAIERQMGALTDMIRATSAAPGTVRERMAGALARLIDHAEANPHGMALLHRAEFQPEEGRPSIDVAGVRELHFQLIEDIVQQAQERGEIRAQILPRDATIALAGVVSFQLQLRHCGLPPVPGQLQRTLDLVFEGLTPR